MIEAIAHRFTRALLTVPSTENWQQSAVLLLVFTLVSLPLGFKLGFLQIDVLQAPWQTLTRIITISLLTPAVTEELFFRVLLLPHTTEHASMAAQWLWGCISLAVFIAYHPLIALSFFPAGRTTFLNPVFLWLAALLGIICTIAYLNSGSLWPSVVIHWLVVVVWLLFFGGYRKLNA